MKESINQGDRVIINLYAPNGRHPNNRSRKDTCEMQNKWSNNKIVGDVSSRCSIICRKSRLEIIEKRRSSNTVRPEDRESWHATVHGATRSQARPSGWTHTLDQRPRAFTEHCARQTAHAYSPQGHAGRCPGQTMRSVIRNPSPHKAPNTFIGIERMQMRYSGHSGMELEMSITGRHLEISHKTIRF